MVTREHEEAIRTLNTEHGTELAKSKQEREAALAKLGEEYEATIENMYQAHKIHVGSLDRERTSLRSERDEFKKEWKLAQKKSACLSGLLNKSRGGSKKRVNKNS